MKRILKFSAAIGLGLAVGGALAAGQYDGIYQMDSSDGSGDFISVHTNGSGHMILTKYRSRTPSGDYFEIMNGSNSYAKASPFGEWELFGGPLVGNTATLTGKAEYGQCNTTLTVVFAPGVTGSTLATHHDSKTAFGNSVAGGALNLFQCRNTSLIVLPGQPPARWDNPRPMTKIFP